MRHGFDTSLLVAHEVACHAGHAGARQRVSELRNAGDGFAVAAQVVTEFVHIVTDPKRFTAPLNMEQALNGRTHGGIRRTWSVWSQTMPR